jgi:hypothetical protein
MISPAEYKRRLQTVRKKAVLEDLAFRLIMENDDQIIALKKEDYLEGNIYGTGVFVSYQSKSYEYLKQSMNPRAGGNVDLIFDGDFIRNFYIIHISQNKYRFYSSDWKTTLLEEHYGKEIFGIDQNVFNQFQKQSLERPFTALIKQTANIG